MEPDQGAMLGSQDRSIPFDANAIPLQGDDDSRQAEGGENLGGRARCEIDEAVSFGSYGLGAVRRSCAGREFGTEAAVDHLKLDALVKQLKQEVRSIH